MQVIWCSSCLAAKGLASTHSPCCCHRIFKRTSSTNCSPKGFASLHAVMPLCFGCGIRHGSSCVLHPASFIRHSLHFIMFHSLSTHTLVTFGSYARFIFLPLRGRLRGGSHITATFTRCQRKAHSTPFRFVHFLLHSASCSPPAALVVLACACRPGCGLSCFLQADSFLPLRGRLRGGSKNHASPCSFRSCLTSLMARSRALSFLSRAPCSHPTSCSRTHSVEATSFA